MINRDSRRPRPLHWLVAFGLVLGVCGVAGAAGPNPGEDSLSEGEMAVGPGATAFIYYTPNTLQVTGECRGVPFSFQNDFTPWPTNDRDGNPPAPPEPTTAKDLVGFSYAAPGTCLANQPPNSTGEFVVMSVSDFFADVPGSGQWDPYTFAAKVQMLWVVESPSNH
jgi:hypothetical protein